MIQDIWIKEHQHLLLGGLIGIEREGLRVDQTGQIATTAHPEIFGCKLENPYITTDFSESQVEMVTPVMNSPKKAYNFLLNIMDVVEGTIGDELLWPSSMPPAIYDEEKIKISQYPHCDEGKSEESYRQFLARKYGKKKQLISGIHYNFSVHPEIVAMSGESREEVYLKIARNFMRYRWLLVYLFGASPKAHDTLIEELYPHAISLRNSSKGYTNEESIILSYNSIQEHVADFKKALEDQKVEFEKELYAPLRLRVKHGKTKVSEMLTEGIQYIEIRNLDLNPLEKIGISEETISFVYLFLLYCWYKDSPLSSHQALKESGDNNDQVALFGRDPLCQLKRNGQETAASQWATEILGEMATMVNKITDDPAWCQSVKSQQQKIEDKDNLPSNRVIAESLEKDFQQVFLEKAKVYKTEAGKQSYRLIGYEDLELSTQILMREAIKRGIAFKVVDRQDNFLQLKKGRHVEYVKQATKTSLDSYSTFLMMENKVVSKFVLDEKGIRVPKGEVYTTAKEAVSGFYHFKDKAVVVKPKSTNFGVGISIIKEAKELPIYEKAVSMAFEHDQAILVEEFIEGKEYRFLVMGDETVGILHRVPANVKGDGRQTIRELVVEKNLDPLRGKGYKTPLEKIQCGEPEKMFLAMQGKSFEDVPEKDEVVYLRENSNISTGGDSLDFTDDVHPAYKEIAVRAAKAAGAMICGVDLMLSDIKEAPNKNNHGVIEINFNPAIHIHDFPYQGKNRKVETKLLDLLFPPVYH